MHLVQQEGDPTRGARAKDALCVLPCLNWEVLGELLSALKEENQTHPYSKALIVFLFHYLQYLLCTTHTFPTAPAIHSLPSALLPISFSKQVSPKPLLLTYSTCVWTLCLQNINTGENVMQLLTHNLQN